MTDVNAKNSLRELAKQLAEIAADGRWEEKRRLWADKNALKKTRPLVLCSLPNEAWEELVTWQDCVVEDEFLRGYELYLRRQLYRAAHIRDDEVIEAVLYSPLAYRFSDWYEGRQRPYSGNRFRAEQFHPVLHEYADLKKLRTPELEWNDPAETDRRFEVLQDVFGGILDVRKGAPTTSDTDSYVKGWGYSAIDILCELRGLENVFVDMAEAPEFVHEAMAFLTAGLLSYKAEMARQGFLRPNGNAYMMNANTPLGSNGLAITDELPASGDDAAYGDLWGYSMAQELSEVSPEMHMEFVLPYQQRMTNDFGLLSYGCCEPNDRKWDNILSTFSNLRALSVSHCADLTIAADKLRDNYVFTWKPNCSVIATFDENEIRRQLSDGIEQTKHCHTVVCLRDNLTLYGKPERAWRWTEIAMELASEI